MTFEYVKTDPTKNILNFTEKKRKMKNQTTEDGKREEERGREKIYACSEKLCFHLKAEKKKSNKKTDCRQKNMNKKVKKNRPSNEIKSW